MQGGVGSSSPAHGIEVRLPLIDTRVYRQLEKLSVSACVIVDGLLRTSHTSPLTARVGQSFFSPAEPVAVVEAVAVHAGETPHKYEPQHASLEVLPAMSMHIEAAATRTLSNR